MQKITDFSGRLGNQMFQFAYIWAQHKKGLIPDIYLQDPKFFAGVEEDILQMFGQGIGQMPYTAIHVRRGDYITQHADFYVNLFEEGYYQAAMALFPEAKFMVFSDDIEWCKKQELFEDCLFSEGFNEIADLNRMASCQNIIIANSSFSFWAAWLAPNPTKRVIAPKKWFKDGVKRVGLLDEWIQI